MIINNPKELLSERIRYDGPLANADMEALKKSLAKYEEIRKDYGFEAWCDSDESRVDFERQKDEELQPVMDEILGNMGIDVTFFESAEFDIFGIWSVHYSIDAVSKFGNDHYASRIFQDFLQAYEKSDIGINGGPEGDAERDMFRDKTGAKIMNVYRSMEPIETIATSHTNNIYRPEFFTTAREEVHRIVEKAKYNEFGNIVFYQALPTNAKFLKKVRKCGNDMVKRFG